MSMSLKNKIVFITGASSGIGAACARQFAQRAVNVYQGMNPLTPDDVADSVVYCATRPPHVNISEVIIMPTDQAAATMVARKPT